MGTQQERLIALLQAKRRADPQGFRKYLPGVIELLPALPARHSNARSPFGLTERERAYHRDGLSEALAARRGRRPRSGASLGYQRSVP